MKHTLHLQSVILFFYILFTTITSAQSNETDSSYFPLKIWSQWSYVIASHGSLWKKQTQQLIDTTILDQLLYYKMYIVGPDEYNNLFPDTILYRSSHDSVFAKLRSTAGVISTVELAYNFNANIGDTVHIKNSLFFWIGNNFS